MAFEKRKIPWNKGIPRTKETIEKIKKSKIGKQIGSSNPNWKGGKYITSYGYVSICSPHHPFKDKRGYVFEHRLIMEKHLGRFLLPCESIHHINGIKNDNRIKNLKLFNNESEHCIHHNESKKRNKLGQFTS